MDLIKMGTGYFWRQVQFPHSLLSPSTATFFVGTQRRRWRIVIVIIIIMMIVIIIVIMIIKTITPRLGRTRGVGRRAEMAEPAMAGMKKGSINASGWSDRFVQLIFMNEFL